MKLKKLTKKITTLALTATMATSMLLSPTSVSAASKKVQRKANKAYAKAIKKNKVAKFTSYSLLEVTGGGTKELITRNEKGKSVNARKLNFYTYNKGKVKKIWSTSDQAITYNEKQKTILSLQAGAYGEEEGYEIIDAYKYNGKKMVKNATYSYRRVAEQGGTKTTYTKEVNGQTADITKEEYKAATDGTVDVWAYNTTTKKALIKKLSK